MIPIPPFLIKWALCALAAAAVVAAVAWGVHTYNESLREDGREQVRAEWAQAREVQAAAALKLAAANAAESARRAKDQAKAEQRKTDEIHALDRKLAAALGELRNRPDRPAAGSGAAGNPAAAQACTGAELFRPDADFLVREAARADRIRIERDALWEKYDALSAKP